MHEPSNIRSIPVKSGNGELKQHRRCYSQILELCFRVSVPNCGVLVISTEKGPCEIEIFIPVFLHSHMGSFCLSVAIEVVQLIVLDLSQLPIYQYIVDVFFRHDLIWLLEGCWSC